MSKFAKGSKVQQVVTPIRGEVTGYQVDAENGTVQVGVSWVDAEGVAHSRYFAESELQVMPEDTGK